MVAAVTPDLFLVIIQSGLGLGMLGLAFKLGAFQGTVNKTLDEMEKRLGDVLTELRLGREAFYALGKEMAAMKANVEDHARRLDAIEHA